MTLENNKTALLCYFKLCASFHSHLWIQTGVTIRKCPIWVKIGIFFVPCDLEIWLMTLKNNRVPLLCYFKLCAWFHSHWWIQTGVTVRKRPNWDQILFWPLWPWPLTSDLDLLHGHHFVNGNICRKFHDDLVRGTLFKRCHRRTDRQTDGWTDRQKVLRAAWLQKKNIWNTLLTHVADDLYIQVDFCWWKVRVYGITTNLA